MRKLHYNCRKYSEPFEFVKYRVDIIDGVKVITEYKKVKAYGSFMFNNKMNSGGNSRTLKTNLSLLTQNPPFLLDENYRVIINNTDQYIIESINYNALTRGEINLILSWEKYYNDKN